MREFTFLKKKEVNNFQQNWLLLLLDSEGGGRDDLQTTGWDEKKIFPESHEIVYIMIVQNTKCKTY